ncbi:MAG: UbiA family prenyltransferase [Candidatus Korarchaeota archaeon]
MITRKVKAFLELMRLHNAFMGSLGVVIGILLSVSDIYESPFSILLGITIYVLIASGGNAINDYFDIEVDKVNRPNRPIPRGDVSPREVLMFSVLLWIIGTILSFFSLSPVTLTNIPLPPLVVLFFAILGFLYSAKLKVLGFPGNIVVGISFAFGPLFGAILVSSTIKNTVISCFLTSFFLLVSREIVKGIEDVEGDRLRNVKTIALRYGNFVAALMSVIFDILAIVSFTLVMINSLMLVQIMVLTGDVIVALAGILAITKYNEKKAQSNSSFLLKLGAFVGLLTFLFHALLTPGFPV